MSSVRIPQRRGVQLVLLGVVLTLPFLMLWLLGPVAWRLDSTTAAITTLMLLAVRIIPVLGAIACIPVLVRLLRDPRPLLAIDDDGVRSIWIRDGVLAWRDIEEATVRREHDDVLQEDVLCLALRAPARAERRLDPLPGPFGWYARRRVARTGQIEINVFNSREDAEALAQLVNSRVERARDARYIAR